MLITRRLEFDAGHRIPDHGSQCRHLHGHRYAIEITLAGDIIRQDGNPANGMVMDFSDVKTLAMAHLVDAWDHAFLAYAGDLPGGKLPAILAGSQNGVASIACRPPKTWPGRRSRFSTRSIATPTAIICGSNVCASTKRPTAGRRRFANSVVRVQRRMPRRPGKQTPNRRGRDAAQLNWIRMVA
jgi:queuosine biosynthesis protein QueD